MESNPYEPPAAKLADPPPDSHGLKRRSVVVMILFMLVTLGLYYPVWWFRRRPGLNRLNSPRKLPLWAPLLVAAIYVVQFALGLLAGQEPVETVIGTSGALALTVIKLVVGILIILQTFRIKDMIEEHATPETESGTMFSEKVQLSGLMTFFFSIFYLQWAINHYVVGARAEQS